MSHLFLVNNLIDNSDLSYLSGTELAQFPLSNIQNEFTTKVAKGEANNVDILIDTKVTTPKDTIMLVGSFVDGLGFTAVSLYSSTTTDFTGATEIVIDLSAKYNLGYKQFTATNNRYFKLAFTGTGSATQISKIFLGQAETINDRCLSTEGFKIGYENRSDIATNKYGNRFATIYPQAKTIDGTFKVLDVADREIWAEIIALKGVEHPFFAILDPDNIQGSESKYSLAGYFYFASLPDFSLINVTYASSSLKLIQAG